MKKLIAIIATALLAAIIAGCAAGSAEDASLARQYLPEGVEFIRAEKDDGFTEHKYRDADGNEYTLLTDASDSVRALEYDAKVRSTAEKSVLTEEEAFSKITEIYPEAQLITAVESPDDGRWEWDILFCDGDTLGFYELDAATGDILSYDLVYSVSDTIDPAAIISANIPGAEITGLSIDADDGRLQIQGEAGKAEFTIDIETGTIVGIEYDD